MNEYMEGSSKRVIDEDLMLEILDDQNKDISFLFQKEAEGEDIKDLLNYEISQTSTLLALLNYVNGKIDKAKLKSLLIEINK